MMRNTWTPYAALLLLALVLRLGAIAVTPDYEPRLDSAHYDGLACLLAAGEGYRVRIPSGRTPDSCGRLPSVENVPTAFRPPGWPAVLGGVYVLTEKNRWTWARVLQALIGTAAVGFIGLAAFLLLGRRAAFAALTLGAIDSTLLVVGASLMTEPLFVMLIAAALYTALRARREDFVRQSDEIVRTSWRWVLAAGVLVGAATLVRTNGPALIPVLALLAAPHWKQAWRPLLVMAAGAILVLAPWTVRNAIQMDAFVPVATHAGSALAGAYNERARTRDDFPAAWVSPRRVPEFQDVHRSDMNEVEKQRELRRRALEYAREHPAFVLEVSLRNTLRILSVQDLSWHRGNAEALALPRWTGMFAAAGFWLLLALLAVSLVTGAHRRVPAALWLGPLLLLATTVIAGGEMRYRAPLIPFLVLIAAASWRSASAPSASSS